MAPIGTEELLLSSGDGGSAPSLPEGSATMEEKRWSLECATVQPLITVKPLITATYREKEKSLLRMVMAMRAGVEEIGAKMGKEAALEQPTRAMATALVLVKVVTVKAEAQVLGREARLSEQGHRSGSRRRLWSI